MHDSRPKPRRKRLTGASFAALSDEQLLDIRLKDLPVRFEGSWLASCLDQMNAELAGRGVLVQAHGYLSEEWFSPHGAPGIAFPFYLAHPRLMKLERKMLHEVEGGTRRECMRLLRHEAGHVVQRAYVLHRRKRWRDLFGVSSKPYPDHYRPNPASKYYVQHLRRWYAQCHPDEDFAETFAVWLTPRSAWRKSYAGWPALKKLEYVDELMREIAGEKPLRAPRLIIDPLSTYSETLREHYEMKLARYAVDAPTIFDRDLRKIFGNGEKEAPYAAAFVRRNRNDICGAVSLASGEYPVAMDAAIEDLIDRCRAMKLRAAGSERKMRQQLTALLTRRAVRALYSASRRRAFAV